jgi:hypothetical protein
MCSFLITKHSRPYCISYSLLQERKKKIMHDSSVLANGVGGDLIAPDSLLQEVDMFFSSMFNF